MAKNDILFKEETHQIIGFSMEVLNTIGHGLHEKIYENALVVDFRLMEIPYLQQNPYPVIYKDTEVGTYIPDLICNRKIIVDTKCIEEIVDHEIGQMINYLKITGLRLGLIINFKKAQLEWKRVVL